MQTQFNEYRRREENVKILEDRLKLFVGPLMEQIKDAKMAKTCARGDLEQAAQEAFSAGKFKGKRRFSLEGGWVQFDTPKETPVVKDISEAIRFIVERNIEDTVIKSLGLDRDAANGVLLIFKTFPGVNFEVKTTFRISTKGE